MSSAKFRSLLFMLASSSNYDDEMVTQETPSSDLNCPLCLYLLYRPKTLTECRHTFCHACIAKWFCIYKNCPMCRVPCSLVDISTPSEELIHSLDSIMVKCQFPECLHKCSIKNIDFHVYHCSLNPAKMSPTNGGVVLRNAVDSSCAHDGEETGSNTSSNNPWRNLLNQIGHYVTFNNNHDNNNTLNNNHDNNNHDNNNTLTNTQNDYTNRNYTSGSYSIYLFPHNSTYLLRHIAMRAYFKSIKNSTSNLLGSREWNIFKNGPQTHICWSNAREFFRVMNSQATWAFTYLNDQLGYINDENSRAVTLHRMTTRLLRKWQWLVRSHSRVIGVKLNHRCDEAAGFIHFHAFFWIRNDRRR